MLARVVALARGIRPVVAPVVAAALAFNVRGTVFVAKGRLQEAPAFLAGIDGIWKIEIKGIVRVA